MFQSRMTERELLLRWIDELERSSIRLREMSRFCKAEAQKLEEQVMRLRGSVPPPEPDPEPSKAKTK
ncbi:MAG TPA: hypothetical protein VK602_19030 [Phyllobacterium sp.]|nr:hypothetical protein [Phyllobacterium sp.]